MHHSHDWTFLGVFVALVLGVANLVSILLMLAGVGVAPDDALADLRHEIAVERCADDAACLRALLEGE